MRRSPVCPDVSHGRAAGPGHGSTEKRPPDSRGRVLGSDRTEITGKCTTMSMRREDHDPRPIRSLLRRLIKAPAAWSLIWPIALILCSYIAFKRWGAESLAERYGKLDPAQVIVTEPHSYVRTDIVDEVYRATGLAKLSPLDHQATAKIASAFASHPWVRHVHSVRKLPGGEVDVHLEYREPVAVFHLTGQPAWFRELGYSGDGENDDLYYFPLDGEGVMLPTEKMTLEDAQGLIHIEVWELYPTGNVGTPFGDRRVESAALLAKLLAAVNRQVHVAKITVSGDPRLNLIPQMEITTGDNTRVFWGSPPGMEQPGEREARAKLQDLVNGNFVQDTDLRVARKRRASVR